MKPSLSQLLTTQLDGPIQACCLLLICNQRNTKQIPLATNGLRAYTLQHLYIVKISAATNQVCKSTYLALCHGTLSCPTLDVHRACTKSSQHLDGLISISKCLLDLVHASCISSFGAMCILASNWKNLGTHTLNPELLYSNLSAHKSSMQCRTLSYLGQLNHAIILVVRPEKCCKCSPPITHDMQTQCNDSFLHISMLSTHARQAHK